MRQLLSVVIPSYNEEGLIHLTSKTLSSLLEESNIPYELIFVDDGSVDRTWEHIQEETCQNSSVKGVNFSRNFGKEAAIYAGLLYSSGDCCVKCFRIGGGRFSKDRRILFQYSGRTWKRCGSHECIHRK